MGGISHARGTGTIGWCEHHPEIDGAFRLNDHAEAEAPRRSPALALSSCLLFSRSGLRSWHVPDGVLVPIRRPQRGRIGRAGRGVNLTSASRGVNLSDAFRPEFSGQAADQGLRVLVTGSTRVYPVRPRTATKTSPSGARSLPDEEPVGLLALAQQHVAPVQHVARVDH